MKRYLGNGDAEMQARADVSEPISAPSAAIGDLSVALRARAHNTIPPQPKVTNACTLRPGRSR